MAPGLSLIPCGLAVWSTGTVTCQQGHVSCTDVVTWWLSTAEQNDGEEWGLRSTTIAVKTLAYRVAKLCSGTWLQWSPLAGKPAGVLIHWHFCFVLASDDVTLAGSPVAGRNSTDAANNQPSSDETETSVLASGPVLSAFCVVLWSREKVILWDPFPVFHGSKGD